MSELSKNVRVKSEGQERSLELLLFKLEGQQYYGINVFKVQEVIPYSHLTQLPAGSPVVRGIATLRGKTIPVFDLSKAIGGPSLPEKPVGYYIILTDYNRSTHGFLVRRVDRIISTHWEEVQPPPKGAGASSYMTAVTIFEKEMIGILDVEKVLHEAMRTSTEVSKALQDHAEEHQLQGHEVMVVDDSTVALNQITKALGQIGLTCITAKDGKIALNMLNDMIAQGISPMERLVMIISDIEMPEMNGYTFTTEIRKSLKLHDIYILLHSSISGGFNSAMVTKCGANHFIQKYNPDDLAHVVMTRIAEFNSRKKQKK